MREIAGTISFKNLQPLSAQFRAGIHQSGNVPAGPSEAGRMACGYKISGDSDNNGDGPSSLLQCADRHFSVRHDDINP